MRTTLAPLCVEVVVVLALAGFSVEAGPEQPTTPAAPRAGCGHLETYGTGCPGSGGFVPALEFTGCAHTGQVVTITLHGGLGGAICIVLVSDEGGDYVLP